MQGTFWLHTVGKLYTLWKYIQMDLGKHIAFYHLELAQLWRCPVMWCTVWKGTAQDCIDHMRQTHKVPLSVKAANLAKYFSAWTVTREQWADMLMPSISGVAIDTLLFTSVRLYVTDTGSSVRPKITRLSGARTYVVCVPFLTNRTPWWYAGATVGMLRN